MAKLDPINSKESLNDRLTLGSPTTDGDVRGCIQDVFGNEREFYYDTRACVERFYAQVPKKYWNVSGVKRAIAEKQDSFYIYGPPGSGKTYFAAAVAKSEIMRNRAVKWVSYPYLILQLQSSFQDQGKCPFTIMRSVAESPGLLVIDDLGAEKLTDYVRQVTYFIVNYREQNDLRTIITSNLPLSRVNTVIDPRISSRIAGMCRVVEFSGPDLRVAKKGNERTSSPDLIGSPGEPVTDLAR